MQRYIDRLAEATIAALDLTNAEKAEIALSGELAGASAEKAATIRNFARGLDEVTAKTEVLISAETLRIRAERGGYDRTSDDLRAANLQVLIDRSTEFRRIIAQTPTGQAAELLRLEILLRETIGDSAERADELFEAINTLYGTLPKRAEQATSALSAFAEQASRNIQDALGTTLRDTLSGNFDDIGKRWGNLLLDLVAQATAADFGKALFGSGIGSTGGTGGLFSSLIGYFTGAVGSRAGGGSVKPWSLSRVNENGIEGLTVQGRDYLMTGSAGAKVTPAGGSTRGGDTIINVAAGVSRNELMAVIPALKAQVKAELITAMRRPGFSGA